MADNSIYDAKYTNFNKHEILQYKILDDYYKTRVSSEMINNMINIINGKSHVSLRLLDWFITQYSKIKKTCYKLSTTVLSNDIYEQDDEFYVYLSYKSQLKTYNKKRFDPFRRNKKFYYSFNIDGQLIKLDTTLGQLQFFRWAFENEIIKYVTDNYADICSAMVKLSKLEKIKTTNKKLSVCVEVTSNSDKSSSSYDDDTEITFN